MGANLMVSCGSQNSDNSTRTMSASLKISKTVHKLTSTSFIIHLCSVFLRALLTSRVLMHWVPTWLALVFWHPHHKNVMLSLKPEVSIVSVMPCHWEISVCFSLVTDSQCWKMELQEKIDHQWCYPLHPSVQNFPDTMLWWQKIVRSYVHIYIFSASYYVSYITKSCCFKTMKEWILKTYLVNKIFSLG